MLPQREQFVDMRAMGWGCLASIVFQLCFIGLGFLLPAAAGVGLSDRAMVAPPWLVWTSAISYVLWLLACAFTGYIVARTARFAPARQAVIFSAAYLLVNVALHMFGFALSLLGHAMFDFRLSQRGYMPSWAALRSWVLPVPLMLLGAWFAVHRTAKADGSHPCAPGQ